MCKHKLTRFVQLFPQQKEKATVTGSSEIRLPDNEDLPTRDFIPYFTLATLIVSCAVHTSSIEETKPCRPTIRSARGRKSRKKRTAKKIQTNYFNSPEN